MLTLVTPLNTSLKLVKMITPTNTRLICRTYTATTSFNSRSVPTPTPGKSLGLAASVNRVAIISVSKSG